MSPKLPAGVCLILVFARQDVSYCAGSQWQSALAIYHTMPSVGLCADKITFSSVISALSKGRMWEKALQVSFVS